jgi:hypothetical protein
VAKVSVEMLARDPGEEAEADTTLPLVDPIFLLGVVPKCGSLMFSQPRIMHNPTSGLLSPVMGRMDHQLATLLLPLEAIVAISINSHKTIPTMRSTIRANTLSRPVHLRTKSQVIVFGLLTSLLVDLTAIASCSPITVTVTSKHYSSRPSPLLGITSYYFT